MFRLLLQILYPLYFDIGHNTLTMVASGRAQRDGKRRGEVGDLVAMEGELRFPSGSMGGGKNLHGRQ